MAVRIREDRKTIVCAAKSEKMLGDVYLDDSVHYALSAELGVLRVISQDEYGAELWEFCSPNPHPYLPKTPKTDNSQPMTTPNSARAAAERIVSRLLISQSPKTIKSVAAIIEEETRVEEKEEALRKALLILDDDVPVLVDVEKAIRILRTALVDK